MERDLEGEDSAAEPSVTGGRSAAGGALLAERQWAAGAAGSVAAGYFVPVIGPWAAPLALSYVHRSKQPPSRFFDRHVNEAINYGIAVAAVQLLSGAVGGALVALGVGVILSLIPLALLVLVVGLPGYAALQAHNGRDWIYPEFLPRLFGSTEGGGTEGQDVQQQRG